MGHSCRSGMHCFHHDRHCWSPSDLLHRRCCGCWRFCCRRMRVALFAWESLHTHAVGGVAPHVTELAAGLARQGHEVHVFVRAMESCGGCSVHYGVTYHECTFDLNRDFVLEIQNMCESFIACMLSVEESMGVEFEICHAHDWLAGRALVRAKQLASLSLQI